MFRGSVILRVGLAIVFGYFSIAQLLDPVLYAAYVPFFMQSTSTVYLNAVLDAILAVTILLSVFPRVMPFIGAARLGLVALTLFQAGIYDIAIRDFGIAMACLALAFIHEEHIGSRERNLLTRLLPGRHP
jgi:hypothetical protein